MSDPKPKLLPSFGRRGGRKLRIAKQALMDELLPKLEITPDSVNALFSKVAPSVGGASLQHGPSENQQTFTGAKIFLEIGFGTGTHLAHQARLHPDVLLIGCEPYRHGVGDLLQAIKTEELNNVRVFHDDARLLLEKMPDAALDKVFILYPDPWPKKRHHKRRLISDPFLAALARVMKPGAELRLATDHEDYKHWMQEHLQASKDFEKLSISGEPPSDWVTTRYEQKALREGRLPLYISTIRR